MKVVSMKRIPARFPILSSAVAWLWMDYYHVSSVWRGATYTVGGLVWVVTCVELVRQEQIDLFPGED